MGVRKIMGTVVLDKFENKIVKKYRLVKKNDNYHGNSSYVIEKKRKFLFWSWWSGIEYYGFWDVETVHRHLRVLNGEVERYETVEVG